MQNVHGQYWLPHCDSGHCMIESHPTQYKEVKQVQFRALRSDHWPQMWDVTGESPLPEDKWQWIIYHKSRMKVSYERLPLISLADGHCVHTYKRQHKVLSKGLNKNRKFSSCTVHIQANYLIECQGYMKRRNRWLWSGQGSSLVVSR